MQEPAGPQWEHSVLALETHTSLHLYLLELQTKVPEDFTITEKAPTRAFSWLKAPTSTFIFKTLFRHYAKQILTRGKLTHGMVSGCEIPYENCVPLRD